MTLQLCVFGKPLSVRGKMGFHDWCRAIAHICDHLLTEPESSCWKTMVPDLNLDGIGKRFPYAKALWQSEGDHGQELYEAFMSEMQQEACVAERMGFCWTDRGSNGKREHVFLSLRGIKMVFSQRELKTCFIPMSGRLEGLSRSQREISGLAGSQDCQTLAFRRRKDPLPRQAKQRSSAVFPDVCSSKRFRDSTRHRHSIFRHAAQSVRSEAFHPFKGSGIRDPEAKQRLRVMIRDRETWLAACQQTGRPS